MQSVVVIFVTPMDGRLVIMEGNLLSRFLLLHCLVDIFVIPMDGSLVIMEGSQLS